MADQAPAGDEMQGALAAVGGDAPPAEGQFRGGFGERGENIIIYVGLLDSYYYSRPVQYAWDLAV